MDEHRYRPVCEIPECQRCEDYQRGHSDGAKSAMLGQITQDIETILTYLGSGVTRE